MHSSEKKPEPASHHQFADWRVYAAAATASLAMATTADASIIYSTFAGQAHSNAEGVIAITTAQQSPPIGFASFRLGPALPAGAGVEQYVNRTGELVFAEAYLYHGGGISRSNLPGVRPYFFTGKLSAGQPVGGGAKRSFDKHSYQDTLRFNVGSRASGPFGPGTVTGFVGFLLSYTFPQHVDLGWLRVRVSDKGSPGFPSELDLIDYAYNNAGGSILAGQTTDAVPEPGTAALVLLGSGAAGLVAWRRRSEVPADLGDSRGRIGPEEKR